jgi:hypothetical protein
VCGLEPASASFLGREGAPTPSPDDTGDLVVRLRREHRAHLRVPGLVPADAGDYPQPHEQTRTIRVDGDVFVVEPLDPTVAARDHREAFEVELDAEATWLRQHAKAFDGTLS